MTRSATDRPPTSLRQALVRAAVSSGLLAMLAACAGTPEQPGIPVAQETAHYRAHARSYYAPPGPPDDPWGPYIEEASRRFDVPDAWIRAVIGRESGGQQFRAGTLTTSPVGAMGLMQLMAPTYDDLRVQYSLGDDAYEPHDNIMAGTAYVRQMYDIYGAPGFLAAYNTGPGRLDDFLTKNRPLPRETRQYVAIIGPQIAGIWPNNRSQTDLMIAARTGSDVQYASAQSTDETRSVHMAWTRRRDLNQDNDQPVQVAEAPATPIAPAPTYTRAWNSLPAARPVEVANGAPVASAESVSAAWASRQPAASAPTFFPAPVALTPAAAVASEVSPGGVQAAWAARGIQATPASEPVPPPAPVAALPTPLAAPAARQFASAEPNRSEGSHRLRFQLIRPAMAEPAPLLRDAGRGGARDWSVQVGAFNSQAQASQAADAAQSHAPSLSHARAEIAGVRPNGRGARMYRARLTGLSRGDAMQACERLRNGRGGDCMVVSPDARS